MKKYTLYTLLLSVVFPVVSFAALEGIKGFLVGFKGILNDLLGVMIGLAILFFFWGTGQFILKDSTNEKTREEGKKKMLWGVIALFVIVSIVGILNFIGNSLGIKPNVSSGSGGNGSDVRYANVSNDACVEQNGQTCN